jgi:lipopolysaccharide transport system ATP-binding protein
MTAIQNLCTRGLVLANGKVSYLGDINSSINWYLNSLDELTKINLSEREDRRGNHFLTFLRVVILDKENNEISQILTGQDIRLRFYYKATRSIQSTDVHVSFVIKDRDYPLSNVNSIDSGYSDLEIFKEGYFECRWDKVNITSGSYTCSIFCSINGRISDWLDAAFTLQVENGDYYGSGRLIGYQSKFLIQHSWKSEKIGNTF